jgi:hypothetical protein
VSRRFSPAEEVAHPHATPKLLGVQIARKRKRVQRELLLIGEAQPRSKRSLSQLIRISSTSHANAKSSVAGAQDSSSPT